MGNIKEKVRDSFKMIDLGEISSFLGIQFDRRNGIIKMSQSMYLRNTFKKFDMENSKPRANPCETYFIIKL